MFQSFIWLHFFLSLGGGVNALNHERYQGTRIIVNLYNLKPFCIHWTWPRTNVYIYKLFNTILLNRCHQQTQTFFHLTRECTLFCLCFKLLEDLHHQRCLIIPRMEAEACSVSWAAWRFASSQGWWWQARAESDKKPPAKLGWWGLSHILDL